MRVLVVDPDVPIRRLLRVILEECGCEVLEAASEVEALDRLADPVNRPDVLVSELVLADTQGTDLLHAIRQHPALSDLPVLVLTGQGGDESRYCALQAGADAFLPKPFRVEHLQRVVITLGRVGRSPSSDARFSCA